MTSLRKILLPLLLIAIFGGALAGCAPAKKANGASQGMNMDISNIKMAPLSQMPTDVQKASQTTQDAYRFAVANADLMKQIPCYCGCGDMGHTSNYACYVKKAEDGKITYESHALGCSICVDITQDAMRMTAQGKSTAEIKTFVDATYSKYGPSNIK